MRRRASTLRRWGRTFAGSSDRGTLRRALGRGLREGLRSGPRPNAEVLEEAGWLTPGATSGGQVLPPGQPFALLMSTWRGDRADYLREAFVSTVDQQSRRPAQVVLVQDGPVPDDLAQEIRRLVEASPVPVTHVRIDANVGLGPALDAGLRASRHEIVARMDADDVSAGLAAAGRDYAATGDPAASARARSAAAASWRSASNWSHR